MQATRLKALNQSTSDSNMTFEQSLRAAGLREGIAPDEGRDSYHQEFNTQPERLLAHYKMLKSYCATEPASEGSSDYKVNWDTYIWLNDLFNLMARFDVMSLQKALDIQFLLYLRDEVLIPGIIATGEMTDITPAQVNRDIIRVCEGKSVNWTRELGLYSQRFNGGEPDNEFNLPRSWALRVRRALNHARN